MGGKKVVFNQKTSQNLESFSPVLFTESNSLKFFGTIPVGKV